MWFLSVDRAELHAFVSPEDVPGGYAILSHVGNPFKICARCRRNALPTDRILEARHPRKSGVAARSRRATDFSGFGTTPVASIKPAAPNSPKPSTRCIGTTPSRRSASPTLQTSLGCTSLTRAGGTSGAGRYRSSSRQDSSPCRANGPSSESSSSSRLSLSKSPAFLRQC